MNSPRLALLSVLLALPSCTFFPTVCVKGDGVVIGADDERAARALLPRVQRRVAEVRALLPHTDDDRVVFRISETVRGGLTDDMALQGAYFAPLDWALVAGPEPNDHTIVHEVVHVVLGPRWDRLPLMLEEGLCDLVAARLTDDDVDHEVSHATALWQLLPGFRGRFLDADTGETLLHVASEPTFDATVADLYAAGMFDLWFMDRDRFALSYVAGAFLVERIVDRHGYDGLLALCDEAARRGARRVPLDDALALGGLTRDWADWRAPALAALEPRVARALADSALEAVAPFAVEKVFAVRAVEWGIDGSPLRIPLGSGDDVITTMRRLRAAEAPAVE